MNMHLEEFAIQLRECGNSKSLSQGRRLHREIQASQYANHVHLSNLLVQMYGKCRSVQEARSVFDTIVNKDTYTWDIMLKAYVVNGQSHEVLHLVQRMDLDGIKLDNVSFVTFLAACSSLNDSSLGSTVHKRIIYTGYLNTSVSVGNALVSMYGRFGMVKEARMVFEEMKMRDNVTWNSLITAYAQNGHNTVAFEVYKAMKINVEVSYVTYVVALSACSNIEQGREVHGDISSSFRDNVTVENALIGLYARFKCPEEAKSIFDNMNGRRNTISWNSIIASYVHSNQLHKALEAYESMDINPDKVTYLSVLHICDNEEFLQYGKDIHDRIKLSGYSTCKEVGNALIYMYNKCGSLSDARNVFGSMPVKDTISWNAMIGACVQNGDRNGALQLYHELCRALEPDSRTFVSVLGACSGLQQGEEVHKRISSSIFRNDVFVVTALVSMYGRLGSLDKAKQVFSGMKYRTAPSWNAFFTACCENGAANEVLKLYYEMEVEPNELTYIAMADACSQLGDVHKGIVMHNRAALDGLLQHVSLVNSFINMYGKCKSLEDAFKLFHMMPKRTVSSWNTLVGACIENDNNQLALEVYKGMDIKPGSITYGAVLTACANLGELMEGRKIHARIIEQKLETSNTVGTSLINMYGRLGSVGEAETVFEGIREKDTACWTSMIVAYAQNGHGSQGAAMLRRILLEGAQVDGALFVVILFCCSHAGLLGIGREYFMYMVGDYGIRATVEHYVCMVDLLGRVGRVEDAHKLAEEIEVLGFSEVAWLTLLSACNVQKNVLSGKGAAKRAIEVVKGSSSHYTLLLGLISSENSR